MTDMICRKSMVRCQTPGMCAPYGGCQMPEVAPAFRALLAERNSLAYLLKRFVDGENDQDENQAERHMYHDEAQTLLAYLGGEVKSHTLVPDEALRAMTAERDKAVEDYDKAWRHDLNDKNNYQVLVAEVARLGAERDQLRKGLTDVFNHVEGNTECMVRDLVNWGVPKIDPNEFYTECEAIKAIASAALDASVATPSTDDENVSRHEGGQT